MEKSFLLYWYTVVVTIQNGMNPNKAADNKTGGCYVACFQSVGPTLRINNGIVNNEHVLQGHDGYISSSAFLSNNNIVTGTEQHCYSTIKMGEKRCQVALR